jgi:hypothetical protein
VGQPTAKNVRRWGLTFESNDEDHEEKAESRDYEAMPEGNINITVVNELNITLQRINGDGAIRSVVR